MPAPDAGRPPAADVAAAVGTVPAPGRSDGAPGCDEQPEAAHERNATNDNAMMVRFISSLLLVDIAVIQRPDVPTGPTGLSRSPWSSLRTLNRKPWTHSFGFPFISAMIDSA